MVFWLKTSLCLIRNSVRMPDGKYSLEMQNISSSLFSIFPCSMNTWWPGQVSGKYWERCVLVRVCLMGERGCMKPGKMAEALQWCASVGLSYLIWGAIGLWIPTPLQPIFLSTCSMGYDRREATPGATHCLHGAQPFFWCSLCLQGALGQGLKVLAETPFLHILSDLCAYADRPGDSIAPAPDVKPWAFVFSFNIATSRYFGSGSLPSLNSMCEPKGRLCVSSGD